MSNSVQGAVSGADRVDVSALSILDARWLCALIIVGVTAVALAVRWPYLLLFPRFTDETREALFALEIARGKNFPLTHFNAYIGVIHPYLLAGLFRVFGPHPALPRIVSAVFGALLAGLAAWLGWQFAAMDPRLANGARHRSALAVALLAGGLVAASFPLIVVNSHLGWSNCLTPFFTTLALGVTWISVVRGRPAWLVVAGFLWGVALQTHPTVVTLLPGVAVWIVLHRQGRAWLRTGWPWLAVAAFAVGYGNMIWYNVMTHGGSITEALKAGNAYQTSPTLVERVMAIGAAGVQLSRMLAGAYTIQPDGDFPFELTPLVPLYGALALLALAWAARRIETAILPLAVASAALLLPLVTNTFEGFHDTRYIAFMLPLVYLALALAVVGVWERWRRERHDSRPAWSNIVFAAAAILLAAFPLVSLARLYEASEGYGLTNAPFLATAEAAHARAANGAVVLLDRDTSSTALHGGGNTRRALEYVLTMTGTDFESERPETIHWYLDNSQSRLFLILADDDPELAAQQALTPTLWRGPGFVAYTVRSGQP